MKISQRGLDLIKKYEGFRAKPYLCPAGVPTIGYGATYYPNGKRVKMSDNMITERQAEQMLCLQLSKYESAVSRYIRANINQNQFDALVSFAYNLGIGSLQRSTLLKRVNKNPNNPKIKREFKKWVYAGGRKLKGLIKRRKDEAVLYFS